METNAVASTNPMKLTVNTGSNNNTSSGGATITTTTIAAPVSVAPPISTATAVTATLSTTATAVSAKRDRLNGGAIGRHRQLVHTQIWMDELTRWNVLRQLDVRALSAATIKAAAAAGGAASPDIVLLRQKFRFREIFRSRREVRSTLHTHTALCIIRWMD